MERQLVQKWCLITIRDAKQIRYLKYFDRVLQVTANGM